MDEFTDVDDALLGMASSPLTMVVLSELNRRQLEALTAGDDQRRGLEKHLRLLEQMPDLPVPGGLGELHDYLDARIAEARSANGLTGRAGPAGMLAAWENPDINMPLLQKLIVLVMIDEPSLERLNEEPGRDVDGK